MRHQRQKIPDGSATAKAIDYSLKRWQALTRFLEDGNLQIDNNWVEKPHPPERARAAELVVRRIAARRQTSSRRISLIHSAKLNGHDPYAYLRDVLTRLPTQPASRVEELLPHRRQS